MRSGAYAADAREEIAHRSSRGRRSRADRAPASRCRPLGEPQRRCFGPVAATSTISIRQSGSRSAPRSARRDSSRGRKRARRCAGVRRGQSSCFAVQRRGCTRSRRVAARGTISPIVRRVEASVGERRRSIAARDAAAHDQRVADAAVERAEHLRRARRGLRAAASRTRGGSRHAVLSSAMPRRVGDDADDVFLEAAAGDVRHAVHRLLAHAACRIGLT